MSRLVSENHFPIEFRAKKVADYLEQVCVDHESVYGDLDLSVVVSVEELREAVALLRDLANAPPEPSSPGGRFWL